LPLAAVLRRRTVHRAARALRQARGHREELPRGRRRQARRAARAGLLHGRRHRRGAGEGQEARVGRLAVADRLTLEIATPTRLVAAETVDEIVIPGSQGYFGVLPGHAAFLTTLGIGEPLYPVRPPPRPTA